MLKITVACAALLAVLLTVGGCGGGVSPTPATTAAPAASAVVATAAADLCKGSAYTNCETNVNVIYAQGWRHSRSAKYRRWPGQRRSPRSRRRPNEQVLGERVDHAQQSLQGRQRTVNDSGRPVDERHTMSMPAARGRLSR